MYTYAIGLTSGALMELMGQNPIVPDPYPVEFLDYTTIAGQNGLGEPIEVGPATLTWHWEKMTLPQYNFFVSLNEGRASTPVFIRSRIEGGNTLSFGLFSAIMWRPRSGVKPGPLRETVIIKFTNLVPIDA